MHSRMWWIELDCVDLEYLDYWPRMATNGHEKNRLVSIQTANGSLPWAWFGQTGSSPKSSRKALFFSSNAAWLESSNFKVYFSRAKAFDSPWPVALPSANPRHRYRLFCGGNLGNCHGVVLCGQRLFMHQLSPKIGQAFFPAAVITFNDMQLHNPAQTHNDT